MAYLPNGYANTYSPILDNNMYPVNESVSRYGVAGTEDPCATYPQPYNSRYIPSDAWNRQYSETPNNLPNPELPYSCNEKYNLRTIIQEDLVPEPQTQPIDIPGFLKAHIGQLVQVEFFIGSMTTEKVGYIREVGESYVVLDTVDHSSSIMCDLFSIKFITILHGPEQKEVDIIYQY